MLSPKCEKLCETYDYVARWVQITIKMRTILLGNEINQVKVSYKIVINLP